MAGAGRRSDVVKPSGPPSEGSQWSSEVCLPSQSALPFTVSAQQWQLGTESA